MVIKQGNFPYDISDFTKKADKLFPNEDIVVGVVDESLCSEEIMQQFLNNVLEYEIADKKINGK